jgi:uncharacterized protein YggE
MSSLATHAPTIRPAIVIAAGALLVGLVAGPLLNGTHGTAIARAADDSTPEHTIAVTGTGKVTLTPDMATVSLGVNVERDSAKAARDAAAHQMTRVVDAMKALGIAADDIQTANVSLGPIYDYPANAQPRIRGYQLQNTITITVRDLTKISDVVDDAVQAGATQVNGIGFDVKDRAAAEATAREAAVTDAKAKADTLASGLGVSINGVASIAESVAAPVWYAPNYGVAQGAGDKAETPVLPGSTDVTITVQVAFLIP